jgi:serine/threonine protein kinase
LKKELQKYSVNQFLTGIYQLNTKRVIHQDIKPKNILLDNNEY